MTEPLSRLHQTGSTSSPKQSGGEGGWGGAGERGRWRRASESGSGRKAGGRVKVRREERCSARERAGERGNVPADIIRVRAHSTPPSSVAPAGWRPPGSGSAVGAPACSITAERRGELREEIYFLSLPVEQAAHLHRLKKQPKKHSLRISLTYTQTASGGRGLPHVLSLSLFFLFLPSEV